MAWRARRAAVSRARAEAVGARVDVRSDFDSRILPQLYGFDQHRAVFWTLRRVDNSSGSWSSRVGPVPRRGIAFALISTTSAKAIPWRPSHDDKTPGGSVALRRARLAGVPVRAARQAAADPERPARRHDRSPADRTMVRADGNANVAVRTGQVSGLVVLDVDGDAGADALADLERKHFGCREPQPSRRRAVARTTTCATPAAKSRTACDSSAPCSTSEQTADTCSRRRAWARTGAAGSPTSAHR
jgi:hypothetical protein